jgi:uncharacterized protein YrzB (UPF0473 family)
MDGVNKMEDKEIMTFLDEDGNKMEFEPVARIYVEEQEYLLLSPIDGSEEDAYVFRVDLEDEKEVLNLVEDDEEFNNVKKEYKNLLYKEE